MKPGPPLWSLYSYLHCVSRRWFWHVQTWMACGEGFMGFFYLFIKKKFPLAGMKMISLLGISNAGRQRLQKAGCNINRLCAAIAWRHLIRLVTHGDCEGPRGRRLSGSWKNCLWMVGKPVQPQVRTQERLGVSSPTQLHFISRRSRILNKTGEPLTHCCWKWTRMKAFTEQFSSKGYTQPPGSQRFHSHVNMCSHLYTYVHSSIIWNS